MSTPIISIENLGKRYRLRHAGKPGYNTLRDALASRFSRLVTPARTTPPSDVTEEDFWALKDVSFEVNRGDIVGIIGRNGAGKSTMLKILSRITEPTTGRIRLKGRVASLLEVGTGFHPELSGRENIFLNGAILGMSKGEIRAKFDDIVAFAGVERFLDTPVKHYSSGMYVRLAFAVAAHLDPEIMIVDEVLAVGDADFQKKCLGKMRALHTDGRTVLVVSHQMSMITALCDRGIVMQRGQVAFIGSATEAVMQYQSGGTTAAAMFDATGDGSPIGNDAVRLHRAWLTRHDGTPASEFDLAEPIKIWMDYTILKPGSLQTYPNFHIYDERGDYVFVTAGLSPENQDPRSPQSINQAGRWLSCCTIPAGLMNTGTFTVGIAVTCMNPNIQVAFFERGALMFQVTEDLAVTLATTRVGYAGPMPGTIRPQLEWTVEPVRQPQEVNW